MPKVTQLRWEDQIQYCLVPKPLLLTAWHVFIVALLLTISCYILKVVNKQQNTLCGLQSLKYLLSVRLQKLACPSLDPAISHQARLYSQMKECELFYS